MTNPMLTTPEERAARVQYGTKERIAKEIRAALKELVETAWMRRPITHETDSYIDLHLLEEIVNEVMPEEEKVK